MRATSPLRVSVVIPTLNEATTIGLALEQLTREGPDEIIVVDGGSDDDTLDLVRASGCQVLSAPRGRGIQQNRGAAATSGDVLLFLHADCRLEPGALTALRRFLHDHPKVPGGCFRMRVEGSDWRYRTINAAAHLRAGVLGIPYGDQGIFIQRWAFNAVGGFPETPLMEDLGLALKLRRLGRLALLPAPIHVSSRRWRQQGILRQSILNWGLTIAAALGVSPSVLTRYYPVVR